MLVHFYYIKNDYCLSQKGAGTGHKRWGAEEFFKKVHTHTQSMPQTVRSTVAKREAREVMVSGTSAAP